MKNARQENRENYLVFVQGSVNGSEEAIRKVFE